MSCCLKRWLWFRQEGRVELVLGLEEHPVQEGLGLDLALVLLLGLVVELEGLALNQRMGLLELELVQGLELQDLVLGLEMALDQGLLALDWGLQDLVLGLELVVALDLQKVELELVVVDHFQGRMLDYLQALGQLEEPWVLLPPLEPWVSLELSKLHYRNRTFHAISASSPCVRVSQLSMLSGPAMIRCGTRHASSAVPVTNCWWT